jgi:hypothetical protein
MVVLHYDSPKMVICFRPSGMEDTQRKDATSGFLNFRNNKIIAVVIVELRLGLRMMMGAGTNVDRNRHELRWSMFARVLLVVLIEKAMW